MVPKIVITNHLCRREISFEMFDCLDQSLIGQGQMDQAIHSILYDWDMYRCAAVFNGEGRCIDCS